MAPRRMSLAVLAAVTVLPAVVAAPAAAAAPPGLGTVVSQDCTSSRIRVALVNDSAAAQTFTVTWPGQGTWTRAVAAHDMTHLYFTKPDGTAYQFTTTTPTGFSATDAGTLSCGTALQAVAGLDCGTQRLRLSLANRSPLATTFTVDWPGRSGTPWTVPVPAGATDDSLFWTLPEGTPYSLHVTAPGFDRTESGIATCGLAAGTTQLNTRTILTTTTPIEGVRQPDGTTRTQTVASVRIPALAVTNAGSVIAVADARVENSGDVPGNIQIAMLRSTDKGATFSAPRIIAAPDHIATGDASEGYGDASLLVDRTTGTLFCFFVYAPPYVGFFQSQAGSTSATDQTSTHVRYVTSTDDGVTWSAPVDLNPQIKDAGWAGLFASSGHGIQLSNGRLVQPLVYRDTAGTTYASDIHSDDHGRTWHAGAAAGSGVNESKAIQRGNGTVVQDMRSNSGGNRIYASSFDGTGTFGGAAYSSGMIDPGVNADQLSYLSPSDVDSGGRPLTTATALFSNPARSSGRTDLTVRLSTDNGASWPNAVLLKAGLAGYSTMAVLGDGTVADLYEIGDTGGIVFSRFSRDWLTGH